MPRGLHDRKGYSFAVVKNGLLRSATNVGGPAADWKDGKGVAMIDQKLGGVSKQSGT